MYYFNARLSWFSSQDLGYSWISFHILEKPREIFRTLPRIIAKILARNAKNLRIFLVRKPRHQALGNKYFIVPTALGEKHQQKLCDFFFSHFMSLITKINNQKNQNNFIPLYCCNSFKVKRDWTSSLEFSGLK